MLELSDWEYKTNIINMKSVLTNEVDNMQEQIGNVGRNPKKEPSPQQR